MRRLCEKAGVPYEPPHKLRHGHAVYALKCAQDVADLKAVSQNLMRASPTTTDSMCLSPIIGPRAKVDIIDLVRGGQFDEQETETAWCPVQVPGRPGSSERNQNH